MVVCAKECVEMQHAEVLSLFASILVCIGLFAFVLGDQLFNPGEFIIISPLYLGANPS